LHAASFPRHARLRQRNEFEAVFKQGSARSGAHLRLIAKRAAHGYARFGVTVSKKVARSAVQRNYMKRVAREAFRRCRSGLPSVDLVVVVRKAFHRGAGGALTSEFVGLLRDLTG